MYFLITSSDKIGIFSISSGTIAVIVGVVDNFLPKKFVRFKLWNSYFLPSSINSLHIAMPMSLVRSNKIAPRRLVGFYLVIDCFSFQVEFLSTPLYQIYVNGAKYKFKHFFHFFIFRQILYGFTCWYRNLSRHKKNNEWKNSGKKLWEVNLFTIRSSRGKLNISKKN